MGLITDELLIVETRERPRFTSQQLCAKLSQMAKKLQEDESYGVAPNPESSGGRTGPTVETDTAAEIVASNIHDSKRATC